MNTDKKIKSMKDFLQEISDLKGQNFVYRGQSNKKWDANCSAYRRLTVGNNRPNSQYLLEYNQDLIQKASRYQNNLETNTPEIHLLAKLQHHNAATILIDFTNSALVALWFACKDENTDGKVFCLDIGHPDKFVELPKGDETKSIEDILKIGTPNSDSTDKEETLSIIEKTIKWQPPITENRIIKQDSFFIFNKYGILENFNKKLIICKDSKKSILNELKNINNFSDETMFPDFYGFAHNNNVRIPYKSSGSRGLFQSAIAYHIGGNLEKAIENYTECIEIDPQHANAYYNRGVAKSTSDNKSKDAIKDYDEAIKINPQFAAAYYNCGLVKYYLDDNKGAIKYYDEAIKINPQFAQAYYNRGVAKSASDNKSEDAIKDYNEAIKINPQFAEAYYSLGNAKSASDNNIDDAIKDYDEAIKINPQFANAYYKRGVAKSTLGDNEDAIKDYDEAIKINPQDANAYYNRGVAKSALGKNDNVIEDYDEAIKINPQFAKAYYNRGIIKCILNNHENAIKDYDEAIKINPQFAEAYCNRGIVRDKLGERKEAISDLKQARKLFQKQGDTQSAKKVTELLAKLGR